jgi:hypothetical protein
MIIIDTCSWIKIQLLEEKNIISLKELLYESDLWATHELIEEYRYHLPNFLDINKFSIKSVKIKTLQEYTEHELDPADLSIIEFSRENPNVIAVSDDKPELTVLSIFKVQSYQLSEFLLILVQNSIFKKNNIIKAIKQLREWRNIRERKMKKLIEMINLIS